ncbi:MAG: cytochrome P450 [Proteobacteria bacterium]|nr:cytochrome P450 [Pseudomonadota bacterium]
MIFQDERGTWHLTRYDHVKLLLLDPRFSRRPPPDAGYMHQEKSQSRLESMVSKWILYNDPPEHTQMRSYFSSFLQPNFLKTTKNIITDITDHLLRKLLNKSNFDFMTCFAAALPTSVLNSLFGTQLSQETMRQWSSSVAAAIDHASPADLENATTTVLAMEQYFADKLSQPESCHTGWLRDLLFIKKQNQLSLDDVIAMCTFLLIAGQETLQLSLGLGVIALINHPEQLAKLQQDVNNIPNAVEEILRFCSPVRKLCRWTKEAIQIEKIIIPANQLVVGLIQQANHDPEQFVMPERFDIARRNNRHLTFGCGIHNCIGSLLARFEMQIAFNKLLPHLHRFKLNTNEIKFLPYSSFHYLTHLPIELH